MSDREHNWLVVMMATSTEIKELIALGCSGGHYASYAADRLLSLVNCWGDVRSHMLASALNRKDKKCAEMYLRDWKDQDKKPSTRVSKFVPGDHYHVLGTKFDTLEEAQQYLSNKGYRYDGLYEKHVYQSQN